MHESRPERPRRARAENRHAFAALAAFRARAHFHEARETSGIRTSPPDVRTSHIHFGAGGQNARRTPFDSLRSLRVRVRYSGFA